MLCVIADFLFIIITTNVGNRTLLLALYLKILKKNRNYLYFF